MYCSTNATPTFFVQRSDGVLRPRDLVDREHAAGYLVLDPQHVNLDVPNLIEPSPLRHSDRGARVHTQPDLREMHAEVLEQGGDP